jgi:hypothetical protein
MTIRSNARLAGFIFLLYIATGITSMIISGQATGTGDTAAKLASIAQHASLMRLNIVLTLLQFVYPLILAVTLYALTRDEDRELALMAACCRTVEGVLCALSAVRALGLLSIATASPTAGPDAASIVLGSLLLKMGGWNALVAATCFALGSTLFSWLFLRARSIPVPLAWLGVAASLLLVMLLPAQLAGYIGGVVTRVMWLPMLVFELALAFWLMIKGVAL